MNNSTETSRMPDPLWPEPDFSIWPETRWGALLFTGIIWAIFAYQWYIGPRRLFRSIERDAAERQAYVCRYLLWGFWWCGLDIVETVSPAIVKVTLLRSKYYCFCCLEPNAEIDVPLNALKRVELKRKPAEPWYFHIIWGVLMACLITMTLHFVPCLWWSCDWGPYDGQAIRGVIWFAGWPICLICMILRSHNYKIILRYNSKDGEQVLPLETRFYFRSSELEAAANKVSGGAMTQGARDEETAFSRDQIENIQEADS